MQTNNIWSTDYGGRLVPFICSTCVMYMLYIDNYQHVIRCIKLYILQNAFYMYLYSIWMNILYYLAVDKKTCKKTEIYFGG